MQQPATRLIWSERCVRSVHRLRDEGSTQMNASGKVARDPAGDPLAERVPRLGAGNRAIACAGPLDSAAGAAPWACVGKVLRRVIRFLQRQPGCNGQD
jgi:hypothetical protein